MCIALKKNDFQQASHIIQHIMISGEVLWIISEISERKKNMH